MTTRPAAVVLLPDASQTALQQMIVNYVDQQGWDLLRVTDRPPEAQALAQTGQADVVVVQLWQHFGSSSREALMRIDDIELSGAKTRAVAEPVEDTATGRMARRMHVHNAEMSAPPAVENFPSTAVGQVVDMGDHFRVQRTDAEAGRVLRALGYIRVSTMKEEKISPDIQESHIKDYCTRMQYAYLGSVKDLDLSGRTFTKRINIQKAIQMVDDQLVDVIIVWKWSRFGRNARQSDIHIGIVENDMGGRVEAATESVDSKTPIGQFQRGFFLALAQFESDRMGEIWKDVHTHRHNRGLTHTGTARLGYRREGPGYEPILTVEGEPAIGSDLAECYQRYVMGEGFGSLATWLNERGHRTTRGNHFVQISLRQSMDSGFAAGLIMKTEVLEGRRVNGKAPTKTTFLQGAHAPLIGMSLWTAYLQERQLRSVPSQKRLAARVNTLTGLAKCPYCLSALKIERRRDRDSSYLRYYRCSAAAGGSTCPAQGVSADTLERYVGDWVKAYAAETDLRSQRVARDSSSLVSMRARKDQLEAQLSSLDNDMVTLAKRAFLHEEGHPRYIADEDFQRLRDDIEGQREVVRREIADLDHASMKLDNDPGLASGLAEAWDQMSHDERNLKLRRMLTSVYVFRGGHGLATANDPRVTIVARWDEDEVLRQHASGKPPTVEKPETLQKGRGVTRDLVLKHLVARGPLTGQEMAYLLEQTAVSALQHLNRLERDGMVEVVEHRVTTSRARPARVFGATEAGVAAVQANAAPRERRRPDPQRFASHLGGSRIDILRVLASGPATPQDIADRLSFSALNARKHLQALHADGLVEPLGTVRVPGRGRPSRQWAATEAGREKLLLIRPVIN